MRTPSAVTCLTAFVLAVLVHALIRLGARTDVGVIPLPSPA